MLDTSNKRREMPLQDKDERSRNFLEVSLGYSKDDAINEAGRCLNCKNPLCIKGCPVNINIPGFISKIKEEKFEEAYKIIKESSALPAVCGRVCPQESQCEKFCVRGIKSDAVGIGNLERFVADYHNNNFKGKEEMPVSNNHSVAVIGSGPSGLTCAGDLARLGYNVTIFEALHLAGGVLVYGIPEFRLPKEIVKKEIDGLIELGVKIETNVVIGKTLSIEELKNEYKFDAVYIASGAGLPKFMNIRGENLIGVFSANEFLTRINLMKAYLENSSTPMYNLENVAVVGGGNVAMDAARCAKRLGAKNVYIVYRRSLDELPARKEEVNHAMEEGIIFKLLTNPVEIIGDENSKVTKIKCVEMYLGEPDSSGRRKPIEKENSFFTIDVNTVIMAIGTSPNPLIKDTTKDLDTKSWGGILTDDETAKTSIEGVYAGGDAVTGAATVILAMGAGKIAAKSIHEYIESKYKSGTN